MRESAGMRLAVLFGSFFMLLLASSVIGAIVGKLPGDARTHLLITSAVQCVLAFCLPAFILAKFSSNRWEEWLHLAKAPSWKAIVGVAIMFVITLPAMEWLIQWNSNIHLPASMASIEEQLRAWESNAEETTSVILESHGWLSMLAGVLIIGVLTGFSEELFFRGGLQGIFTRSNMGKNAAVWLAAFTFSFMHFQFFGFLPRLLMGAFFGYLLIWTRSIWVPVIAHALNNSTVVVTTALTGATEEEMASSLWSDPVYIIVSVVTTAVFLILCRDMFFKQHKESSSSWQKNPLQQASGK